MDSRDQDIDLLGDPPGRKLGAGYAGDPGRGPAGETCGSCAHCRVQPHCSRRHYKCGIGNASRSEATDIRISAPACQHWSGGS